MIENKVLIGIVCKHGIINKKRTSMVIRDELKNALFYNGANVIGIITPCNKINLFGPEVDERKEFNKINDILTNSEKELLISQIKLCDGIILQGGGLSDVFEVWIAKYCYEHNIPILGICAGQNNMVRAVGGTTKLANNVSMHYQPNKKYVHHITIDEKSLFYQIVKTNKMKVNSRHKSTIDFYGNLEVVAKDEDENIEVIEDKSKKCFLGIRFHPESLYLEDKNCNRIFEGFLELCKNKE